MMNDTYTITIKPLDSKGDHIFYSVDARKAKEIMQRWDSHQNIQIGDSYISWQRIVEIQAPPKNIRLDKPDCPLCKGFGWVDGLPCKCSPRNQELHREYLEYLNKQEWYKDSIREERERAQGNLREDVQQVFEEVQI